MIHKTDKLSLRVNGHVYDRVLSRFAIEDGYPGGAREVVVDAPLIGPFALTPECHIELDEDGEGWKVVSLPYFIARLQAETFEGDTKR